MKCCSQLRPIQWGRDLLEDLAKPARDIRVRWMTWVVAPALFLIAATLLCRLTNLDLGIQSLIYRAGGNSWVMGDHPFWAGVYQYGTLPAAIVVFLSLAGYLASFFRDSCQPWRMVFIFNILLIVLSAGVITNLGLKEYWGRPRPREVEGLGGHKPYHKILDFDPDIDGKSFPCGHATMGFFFLGGFFLLRQRRRGMSECVLAGALVFGGVIGIARMVQGGHFFSDVIWAAAVCWYTALGLFFGLRLHHGFIRPKGSRKQIPLWARIGAGLAGVGMLIGIGAGSPYREQRNYSAIQEFSKEGTLRLRLMLIKGEIDVVAGSDLRISGEAYGHGLPTSKLAVTFAEQKEPGFSLIVYKERLSGWFAEVKEQLTVSVPWEKTEILQIDSGEAEMWIRLDESMFNSEIHLVNGSGQAQLITNGVPYEVIRGKTDESAIWGAQSEHKGENRVRIFLGETFTGEIGIQESEAAGGEEAATESARFRGNSNIAKKDSQSGIVPLGFRPYGE